MKKSKKILTSLFVSIICVVLGFGNNVQAESEAISPEYNVIIRKKLLNNNYVSSQILRATGDLRNASIPSSFDLREKININVENQEDHGICWAFGSLGALKTHLALKEQKSNPTSTVKPTTPDLSEWHLNFLASNLYGKYKNKNKLLLDRSPAQSTNHFDVGIDVGGSFLHTLSYYKNNDGPILESELPYNTFVDISNENVKKTLDDEQPDVFVHNVEIFPNLFKIQEDERVKVYNCPIYDESGNRISNIREAEDVQEQRSKIKQHIMENGGIYTHIRIGDYFTAEKQSGVQITSGDENEIYSQYDDGTFPTNAEGLQGHAVTIIGWNDSYGKEKFHSKDVNGNPVTPKSEGAYLALNSQGLERGDHGYFWISYDDYSVEHSMFGYTEVNKVENKAKIEFSNNNAYSLAKDLFATQDGEITMDDENKSIEGVDIVFNSMIELDITGTDDKKMTSDDLAKITAVSPNLNRFYLNGNKIDSLSFLNPYVEKGGIGELYLYYQKLDYSVGTNEGTFAYPELIRRTRNPQEYFVYAGEDNNEYTSGLFFSGCRENSNKTGIIFDEGVTTATVTVLKGGAAGTVMTVTRNGSSEPTLTSIQVSKPKESYYIGDTLNLTNWKIIKQYSDNSETQEDVTEEMVSGFDSSTAGEKNVTVNYQGHLFQITVTVNPILERIEIDKDNPPKTSYNVGDQLDKTIGKIKAIYNNGTGVEKTIEYKKLSDDGVTFEGFNTSNAVTKTVTIKYGGKSTTYEITVLQQEEPPELEELESISVKTPPTNQKTYYKGDRFDITGLVLEGTNNNGRKFDITEGYDYSPKTLNTVGRQKITITYKGKTTEYYVEDILDVVITKIEVNLLKDTYYVGEKLDLSKVEVIATKNNGTTQKLNAADFIKDEITFDKVGTKSITIKSGDVSQTFEINVIENPNNPGEDPGENPGEKPGENQGTNQSDKPSGSEKEQQEDKPKQQQTQQNTPQKQTTKQNTIETKDTTKSSNEKKTQSDKEIPYAGYMGMGISIAVLIILAIIFYKKYRDTL